jgi:hypothetical protein
VDACGGRGAPPSAGPSAGLVSWPRQGTWTLAAGAVRFAEGVHPLAAGVHDHSGRRRFTSPRRRRFTSPRRRRFTSPRRRRLTSPRRRRSTAPAAGGPPSRPPPQAVSPAPQARRPPSPWPTNVAKHRHSSFCNQAASLQPPRVLPCAPQWIRTTDLRLRRPALSEQIGREKRGFWGALSSLCPAPSGVSQKPPSRCLV